jgi:murein DD-endopeptidase MepM/ murein hydrolase activator NlpD
MFDLLKKLFDHRNNKVRVIVLDDANPEEDNSYNIYPNGLFGLILLASGILVVLVAFIFMVTPLGGLLYSNDKAQIRAQVIDITEKTIALEDSLRKRDLQLLEIKNIIRLSLDTTLTTDKRFENLVNESEIAEYSPQLIFDQTSSLRGMSQNEIVLSNIAYSSPAFPAKVPVQGTHTREYLPAEEHYGIDIATKQNQQVFNVAHGSVIKNSWTINNGYTLLIQHNDGIITVYKHLAKVNKKEGDIVLEGDILGETGNTGVLSTGPHLHFEIWKNGVPQNPNVYLIQ